MSTFGFFGNGPWTIAPAAGPWSEGPSIHRFLVDALQQTSTSLSRAHVTLPDEELMLQASGIDVRWVAGGYDAVLGPLGDAGQSGDIAKRVLAALAAVVEQASDDRVRQLYALLLANPALDYVDALLPLVVRSGLRLERVRAVAHWLATSAAHREPVKAAIALLGIASREERELLMTLGRHEEFTLFTSGALLHSEDDAEPLLLELAQHVTGWGRVQIVERLAAASSEQTKAWLLREGCRNDILPEYTALTCAVGGGLLDALRMPAPDRALIKGAGVILAALICGNPGPGMENYSDGPEAVERYLAHLRARDADPDDLNVVAAIVAYVAAQLNDADGVAAAWSRRAEAVEEHARAIRSQPGWPSRIQAGLASPDRVDFVAAVAAGAELGIDTWDAQFARLQAGGDDWHFVMQTDDATRIDKVVHLAEEVLPLDELASGPANESGFGPGSEGHRALLFVLQELGRFPGHGWVMIAAGLRSPVTANRIVALRSLRAWPRSTWPDDADAFLERAIAVEPNSDTRERLRKLLDGTLGPDE